MYIVNIRIPDDLKGKVKINLPEQIKIRETKEKSLKVEITKSWENKWMRLGEFQRDLLVMQKKY